MKRKHVIATFALSALLGVGVFAGLHAHEAKEAKADGTTTLYCKCTQSWWKTDSAAVGAYYFVDDNDHNTWPGIRGTLVSGDTDVWKFEIPSTYPNIIFTRINGSGDVSDWGAKTADLVIPTDGKNLYTITSESAVWGNPGVTGSWSTYVEPTPTPDPVYTVEPAFLTAQTFANDDAHKPGGTKHQWKATITGNIARLKDLVFKKDGVALTSGIGVDYIGETPAAGNNIVGDATNGFKVYYPGETMDIYLKEYDDGGLSLWGTGYQELTFSMFGSTLSLDADYEPAGDYIKQFKTPAAVALTTEDERMFDDPEGNSQTFTVENVAGQNAVAVNSSKFTVHNNCNEVVYLKMKNDYSLHLFVGGYIEQHVLVIGERNIPFTKYSETEYRALGVEVVAGETVTAYKIENVAVEGLAAKIVGNNNLGTDMKIIADATADIYYNVNTKKLHVSGLPTGGYHILRNGHEVIQMAAAEDYGEHHQYKSESISFAANDYFTFLDTNGEEGVRAATKWTIQVIETAGLFANFEYDSTGDVIKCITACNASVWMKLKEDDDMIYFGARAQYIEDAIDFANEFKTAMATACAAEGKKAAVEAAWAAKATSFASLVEGAQNEIKLGNSSTVEEIREFHERYVAIKQQHGDWTLDNFAEYDIASANYNTIGFKVDDSTMLVVVISSVAIISAAGLFFLIRRKRHLVK